MSKAFPSPWSVTFSALAAALILQGCGPNYQTAAPKALDLRPEIQVIAPNSAANNRENDVCWQSDIHPAIIETTTRQREVSPAKYDAKGQIIASARYVSESYQRILTERTEIRFKTPCPDTMHAEFNASLQRALKARGLFPYPITGEIDQRTRDALRKFQQAHGLDSAYLALATAQYFGLLPHDLKRRADLGPSQKTSLRKGAYMAEPNLTPKPGL